MSSKGTRREMTGVVGSTAMRPWQRTRTLGVWACSLLPAAVLGWANDARAGSITFSEIVGTSANGLQYERVRSAREANFDFVRQQGVVTLNEAVLAPMHGRGSPGVAVFDYDGDGDLDFYVTNGPGAANKLFANQLQQTGQLNFVDVASSAGVAAVAQDSSGVCAGDTDNDGDQDLLVLSAPGRNLLFENMGNGSFNDITAASGIGDTDWHSMSCSMGDINGDGALDIVVGNAFNLDHMLAIFAIPFDHNEPNELYLNNGANTFTDISDSSGFRDLAEIPPGEATITWAIAMVDFDRDGDMDIVAADDQGAFPSSFEGGFNRGFLHLQQNDGSGHFTDITLSALGVKIGAWMGLDYGDLNCDGQVDMFSSNLGDYLNFATGEPLPPGALASRWFLGLGGGNMLDPGVGALVGTPFGWGTSIFDYDNDGDPDILSYGGLDNILFVDASNHTGMLLENDNCSANFSRDAGALLSDPNWSTRRNVTGLAIGDLDRNGFADVVSVAAFDFAPSTPLVPFPSIGSPFDSTAAFIPTFAPTGNPEEFAWTGILHDNGTLSVQMNNGNSNGWVNVRTLGSVGLTATGNVNRDGIGALVQVTPKKGLPTSRPVMGGSSYASTHSKELIFGLGSANSGTVDVFWPGGVHNRLYRVRPGERLVFPEIPCSIEGPRQAFPSYKSCVEDALLDLHQAGVLSFEESVRFKTSALQAYFDR